MFVRAKEGTCLAALVRMTIPIARAAEKQCPRTGPGRPPEYEDWKIAVLIMIGIFTRRKSKSAQYRFLHHRRRELCRWLELRCFPSRATYFQRYRRAHRLFEAAIRIQGRRAIDEGLADPTTIAVDKSLIKARGALWHQQDRRRGHLPRGVDPDSTWGFSTHHAPRSEPSS